MNFACSSPVTKLVLAAAALAAISGCSSDAVNGTSNGSRYVLGSVVIDADGNRTTYVQTIAALEGNFTNESAIELVGNGTLLAGGKNFFVGLAEEPTWVRYTVDSNGKIGQTGRMSLANIGASQIDYGNVWLDETTAVSVFSSPAVAIIWDPSTMTVTKEVDLSELERPGYELEVWTTTVHDGLVYIPGRWADWDAGLVLPGVSTTILDPKSQKVLGTATDDRCTSAGQVVFDQAGYGYVMADGRNYAAQLFASDRDQAAPENCVLRLAPGATKFDPDYFYTVKSLTGGHESITELETGAQGSGFGFAKMFYEDKLPEGVKPDDNFDFWNLPVHKTWRIKLADPPLAEEVQGVPFSNIGFTGSSVGGRYYSSESPDGSSSDIYETDPETNQAVIRFSMVGYFDGLYELTE
ncbi:MAG: hypothetical protein ABW061_06515 [Polyangiaceae bacterium]